MILIGKNLLFCAILFACVCSSCKNSSSKQKLSGLKKIVGSSIVLPKDSVLNSDGMKVLVIVEDTGECSICNLHIYDWYVYKLEIDKRNFQCEICYLLDDKKTRLPAEIVSMLAMYNIHYSYSLNEFNTLNSNLKDCGYDVFLLSPDDKISLVGSPIENEELWRVYKEVFNHYYLK